MKEIRKVLLIHPEISRTKYNFAGVIDNEPLELEYIAALLREQGVDYAIWDGQVERISAAEKLKATCLIWSMSAAAPDRNGSCWNTARQQRIYAAVSPSLADCMHSSAMPGCIRTAWTTFSFPLIYFS